jgi:hypothetical protein
MFLSWAGSVPNFNLIAAGSVLSHNPLNILALHDSATFKLDPHSAHSPATISLIPQLDFSTPKLSPSCRLSLADSQPVHLASSAALPPRHPRIILPASPDDFIPPASRDCSFRVRPGSVDMDELQMN